MTAPLVALVGTTASGKTDLALKLAKEHQGEIISADSWLIRKEMHIGTARPSAKSLRMVPHHMIDLVRPTEDYSAARYKREANRAIADVSRRGKLPLLVGGTGLYIDSILYNYSFMPSAGKETRAKLNSLSLPDLHRLALDKGLDLDSIDERNKRRVIRLIETDGMIASRDKLRNNTLIVGLDSDREALNEAVTKRVDEMIAAGLQKEVEDLSKKYGWDCEALKGIGYREWHLFFDGVQTLDTVRERIIKDTLRLAKRQKTWFKRNKSIHWFTTPVNYTAIDDLLTAFLSKSVS